MKPVHSSFNTLLSASSIVRGPRTELGTGCCLIKTDMPLLTWNLEVSDLISLVAGGTIHWRYGAGLSGEGTKMRK